MPPSPKQYKSTINGVFGWAQSELAHVGRIAAIEDRDLQYAYALSAVNGMLHLRNSVYELLHDGAYQTHSQDLQRLYDQVNRAVQHLISEYKVERNTIEKFNTRHVLGNVSDLLWVPALGRRRGGRKTLKRSRK